MLKVAIRGTKCNIFSQLFESLCSRSLKECAPMTRERNEQRAEAVRPEFDFLLFVVSTLNFFPIKSTFFFLRAMVY